VRLLLTHVVPQSTDISLSIFFSSSIKSRNKKKNNGEEAATTRVVGEVPEVEEWVREVRREEVNFSFPDLLFGKC